MMVALDVLEELGFVIQSGLGYERSLQLVNTAAKADLANSKILQSIGKGR